MNPKSRIVLRKLGLILAIPAIFVIIANLMHPETIIPPDIKVEIETALKHYPELKDVPLEFKFKKNIKKSVMLAQPSIASLVRPKSKRAYVILISETFKITGKKYRTRDIPKNILIGWIGHELGHVMDYQQKSNWQMIGFGIRYVLFKEHVKEAERAADMQAVEHGMSEYIIATKKFILDNAEIDEAYKARIRQFYLSPEEIREIVAEQAK